MKLTLTSALIEIKQKNGRIGVSEQSAAFNLATSTAVYDNAPKTREMILAEREYKDFNDLMIDRKRGVKHHILSGHGATQDTFEKRDFATTNDMVYERRAPVETIINPHTFESDAGRTRSKQQINTQANDLPTMFGKSGTAAGETVPKHYNQFTGKFDNNSLKIGLRQ